MSRPELGTKRVCASCATKFYDLMKDPILCPKCGTKFLIATAAYTAVAAPAAKALVDDDAAVDLLDPNIELISLEDLETDADDKSADGTEDDTFLEEEEDETNVTDFIDGDIENEDDA